MRARLTLTSCFLATTPWWSIALAQSSLIEDAPPHALLVVDANQKIVGRFADIPALSGGLYVVAYRRIKGIDTTIPLEAKGGTIFLSYGAIYFTLKDCAGKPYTDHTIPGAAPSVIVGLRDKAYLYIGTYPANVETLTTWSSFSAGVCTNQPHVSGSRHLFPLGSDAVDITGIFEYPFAVR